MKIENFPYLALGMGFMFFLTLLGGSVIGPAGRTLLPLLTLLVVSEFAFFLTAIGAYIGATHYQGINNQKIYLAVIIACVLLSIRFVFYGIALWPL